MAVADYGLTVWSLTGGAELEPNIEPHLKRGRQVSEKLLSGITSDKSHLYLLTENYASIIVIDPVDASVVEVMGLPDEGEVSDIALSGGVVYISVDHNLFDERPPLRVHALD